MQFSKWFTKLMESKPNVNKNKKTNHSWIVDESKCLTIDEVERLKNFCNNLKHYGLKNKRFTPVRNWFMVELGSNTGLRVTEMTSLKHKNLLIDGERSSIIVIGKGGKKRAIWISSDFKKICKTYINYKKQFGYSIEDEAYLLNNIKGMKITKRSLQKFFKAILEKSSLPNHYYIHCLRHTYTTFLLKASNYNYRFVQQQLGHSSIRTTQIYASVVESDTREALEKLYK